MRRLIFWPWTLVFAPAIGYTTGRVLDLIFGLPDDFDVAEYISTTQPRTPPPHGS